MAHILRMCRGGDGRTAEVTLSAPPPNLMEQEASRDSGGWCPTGACAPHIRGGYLLVSQTSLETSLQTHLEVLPRGNSKSCQQRLNSTYLI